ncbi:UDP-glucuronic acid decarboxylase family protein [Streptomyces sp. NPDC016845]|uniref:UDP-glucuronic acid decarboxylase family protein n=1 Tax=Streptomyces sp. NPDC016845 TaxID=3364972 RepID=UPI0037B99487
MENTVVVTGGAGFIGSHLCRRLLSEGHRVICVDNFLTGRRANIDALLRHDRFALQVGDVADLADMREVPAVAGRIDAVLHLASPASPIDYQRHPCETLRAGGPGTLAALDLALRHRARFLLASTSETYGDPLVHPQPESYWGHVNPVGPRSVYDEAKRYAEAATAAYRRVHGLSTIIVRLFNTYGPGMRRDDGRAVPAFIDQALRGQPLTVAGDGSQTRSLCYIDDMVDGLTAALAADHGGPVNLGNPIEMSVLELARLVRDVAGSSSGIEFVARPQDDPCRRRPDTALARAVLGWEPLVPPREGIHRTVAWFRAAQGRTTTRTAATTA